MLKHYLYILLATLCSLNLFAQTDGQANIFLDSTSFLIGDQITMQIVVNAPVGNTVTFPAISNLLEEEKLELVDQKETELIEGDVNNTFKKDIVLTTWEPGQYQIPAFSFSYKKNGALIEFKSATLMVTALSPQVTGDSTFVADIKTILAEEATFWDHLYYFFTHPVTVAIIILLLAFLAFYGFMWYKNRPKPGVPRSPEEIALEELEALKESTLLAEKQFQEFHTRISAILRGYFNARFKIKALEYPVSYFLPQIKEHKYMKAALFEECQTVLEHAALIKFAKASPLDVANKKALDFCFELIQSVQTKLEEEAAALAAAKN